MKKYTYPYVVILNEESKMMNGYIPDLAIFAECKTKEKVTSELGCILKNYIDMAEKYKTEIPVATPIENIRSSKKWEKYEIAELTVECDD